MNTTEADYLDFIAEDFPIRNENRTRKLSCRRLPKVKLPPKVRDAAEQEPEEQRSE